MCALVLSACGTDNELTQPKIVDSDGLAVFYTDLSAYLSKNAPYSVGIGPSFKQALASGVEYSSTFVVSANNTLTAAESFLTLLKGNVYVEIPINGVTQKVMYSVLKNRPGVYISADQFQELESKLGSLQGQLKINLDAKVKKDGRDGELTLGALDQINLVYNIVRSSPSISLGLEHHASLKKIRLSSRNLSQSIVPVVVKNDFSTINGIKVFNANVGYVEHTNYNKTTLFAQLNLGNVFIEALHFNSKNVGLNREKSAFNKPSASFMLGKDFDLMSLGVKRINFGQSNVLIALYGETGCQMVCDTLHFKASTHLGLHNDRQTYVDIYLGFNISASVGSSFGVGILVVPQQFIEAQLIFNIDF